MAGNDRGRKDVPPGAGKDITPGAGNKIVPGAGNGVVPGTADLKSPWSLPLFLVALALSLALIGAMLTSAGTFCGS